VPRNTAQAAAWWRPVVALAVVSASSAAAASSATAAWVAAVLGGGLCAALAWRRAPAGETAGNGSSASPADATGPRLMVSELVPVWQRHLDASKAEAEKGVGGLLESFGRISGDLGQAAQQAQGSTTGVGFGSADAALDEHAATVESLLEPMHKSRAERDAMVGEMLGCSEGLAELGRAAKELRELARHTHLVAFNASIEANRAGESGAGFGAVALEVRTLAARSNAAAQRIGSQLGAITGRIDTLRKQAELATVGDEELSLLARSRAREVAVALVSRMAGSLSGSNELRETAQRMSGELEQVFMGFQFQDRLTQMLDIVRDDMGRLAEWLQTHPYATRVDVAQWLEALDQRYTMESQRNQHHGQVSIDRAAKVDFF
jgi:methyl-accepting chemotaxis protein